MMTPKPPWLFFFVCFAQLTTNSLYGQVEVTDQSALHYGGEGGYEIGAVQESFTPSSPAISFVDFGFYDSLPGNGIGTQIYINLRQGTFNGQILGRTKVVTVPDGARELTKFEFPQNIRLIPESPYFLEPVRVSGDSVYSLYASYQRGSRYYNGIKAASSLIFREGFLRAEITSLSITNNFVNITWRGIGSLQTAPSVFGPWIEFPDNTNGIGQIDLQSYGISTNGVHIFRVRD
jgi:hypothetical protein